MKKDPETDNGTLAPPMIASNEEFVMHAVQFNRDDMARWYAKKHLKTDTGTRSIYYLPRDAAEREIRFVEINDLMAVRESDPLEPIDFGVDIGSKSAHRLLVLDVTPSQWEKIQTNEIPLPPGWTLDGAAIFDRTATAS